MQQLQIVEASKNEPAMALKVMKKCCKEFVFTICMPKDPLAEGQQKL